jgi:hypothetical protein
MKQDRLVNKLLIDKNDNDLKKDTCYEHYKKPTTQIPMPAHLSTQRNLSVSRLPGGWRSTGLRLQVQSGNLSHQSNLESTFPDIPS